MLIEDEEGLAAFARRARQGDVLAIDTEFLREKTYRARLCLLQLGTAAEQAAVDPFKVDGSEVMRDLLTDPAITKVLHACSQDVEILLDRYGVLPTPLFDTQIAAAFLGDHAQIGYGALVEEYCGVHLAKSESLTDWSRRPLDHKQMEYAYDDVRYLPAVFRQMSERLRESGREEWVLPEMRRASDPATYRHDPLDAWRRLKRTSSFSRRQLAVAREVCAWRERRARSADRPRRWIMSDEVVVEVCRRLPRDARQLRAIRGADALSASDQAAVVAAVARAMALPEEDCPQPAHHARPTLEQECVCDLMYALARKVAQREGVAQSVLASREDLMEYLRDPASSPLSEGWRHDAVGRSLDDLLAGRLGLTVREGNVELV